MKITKWFMVAACVLFCAACSKNDPLAYVDEDADVVFYVNTYDPMTESQETAFKREFGRSLKFGGGPIIENYKFLGVDLLKTPAKIALWGESKKDKKDPEALENERGVIVLKDETAKNFMDECEDFWKDQGDYYDVEQSTVDGKDAYLFIVKKTDFENGKKKEEIRFTIVATGEKIMQIFFEDEEPDSLLKPEKKSELADLIENDAFQARAISGDLLVWLLKHDDDYDDDYDDDIPELGNSVEQFYFKGDELVEEMRADVSEIIDD